MDALSRKRDRLPLGFAARALGLLAAAPAAKNFNGPGADAASDATARASSPVSVEYVTERLGKVAAKRNSEIFLLAETDDAQAEHSGAGTFDDEPFIELPDFLRRYRKLDPQKNIDLILLRSGLTLTFVTLIGRMLEKHAGKVTVIVPRPVFGHASLLALAADEVVMAEDAWLSFDNSVTKHLEKVVSDKGRRNMDDLSLLYLHSAVRERTETAWLACEFLHGGRHHGRCSHAKDIARGRWSVASPARADTLRRWGLKVVTASYIEEIEIARDPVFSVTVFGSQPDENPVLLKVLPTCLESCPIGNARTAITTMEETRNSKVISIIHAAGTDRKMVDLQTAADALKAIRNVPHGKGIDLILHTFGGLSMYGEQIARALKDHRGHKSIFIPYYAFSAGTIIALSGNDIHLSGNATLGPIDSQFPLSERLQIPASAFVALRKQKPASKIEDDFLIMGSLSAEVIAADFSRALEFMKGTYSRWRARGIARFLNDGHLTHGYPVMYKEAKRIGLNVTLDMPEEVFTIVDEFTSDPGTFCSVIHCSG
jgi:ClpP class serine protease